MTDSKKQAVGKGAAYIYLETIVSMISGYVFWIIMSKIAPPDVIGTSSAVISFAGIIAVVANIGIPTGLQRFLGRSLSDGHLHNTRVFVKSSLVLVTLGIVTCTFIILIFRDGVYTVFKIDFNLMLMSLLLIISSAIATLFRGIIISSLKTRVLLSTMFLASSCKLILSIILVIVGYGVIGLTIGFTINQIVAASILGIATSTIIFRVQTNTKKINSEIAINFMSASKNILIASEANWIPTVITTIGSQLGTLVVFGSLGSNQAGVYFISLTIVTGLTGVMYSLFTVALPVLSSMDDGRKRFAWHALRLSLIIVLPFSSSLIVYSKQVLDLLGHGYVEGSLSLQIMLLSILPTAVGYGITSLIYSYGNYRQVLAIGLSISIPRSLFYFMLVPLYGVAGAAISYTVGSIVGLAVSVVIAKKIKMKLFWKSLSYVFVIPIVLSFTLYNLHINYIAGIAATIVISYVFFFKLHVLNRTDIYDSLKMLPYGISNPTISLLTNISRKLGRYY